MLHEWVESSGISAALLALFILVAVSVGVRRTRKSGKAKEEEFRRLQGLASQDQVRAEAEWEEEYKKLKQSDISRAKLRHRGASSSSSSAREGGGCRKQTEAEAEQRRRQLCSGVEANPRVLQTELESDLGKQQQQADVRAFNRKKQGEIGAALNREQQEVELEEATSRKQAEEQGEAHSKKRAELETVQEVAKHAEEEVAELFRKRGEGKEANLQQQQAELEAKPGQQADELGANCRAKSVEEEQYQGEVLVDAEPQKKQMMVEGGYFCAACGKTTRRRCKQCKGVHYCSPECQMQHWFAVHKFECHRVKPGSPIESLDADSWTFSEVLSPGSSRSENHKGFADFVDTGSVNEVGPPLPMPSHGRTIMSRLPSSIVVSEGQQLKPKKILFPYDHFMELFDWDMLTCPPCGLINCGNSCFANVVLQCLYHTRPLTAYLLEEHHGESCSRHEWCLMCELQKHVQKVNGSQVPVSPIDILSRVQKIGRHPGYGRQEDAHEIMRLCIDLMQMICLDHVGGEKAVDVSIQETSVIHHIFGGCLQSQVKCMQCLLESNRYEPMMDLAVEIQGDIKSLEGALTQFTGTEVLDGVNKYKCERCNSYVKAHKQLTVYKAPNILTVALKRFQGGKFGKLNKRVAFPEALNMMPYMSQTGDQPPLYHLYAVVVHLDVLNASDFGHYICYVKNSLGDWYKVDDTKVDEVELHEVTSQRAYMLFYARSSARPTSVIEDGSAHGGSAAQQSPEPGRGTTVQLEHLRSSLCSLWALPEPVHLIRSLPDPQSGHNSSTLQYAGGGRSRANSSNLISISHDSLVAFQSASGNLEHSLSFQLSGPPWDVMIDENQQPRSSIKGLGKLVKRRLFKGLSSGLFSKPLEKDHLSAVSAGTDSRPQLAALSSSSPSKRVLPSLCVNSSCIACSMWDDKPIPMYSRPEDVWENFLPIPAQQQHSDSALGVSGAVDDPEQFQLFEASSSRQLEINNRGQRAQGRGTNLRNCSGMLCGGGYVRVLHPGEVDVHHSNSGFSHILWTTTEDQKKVNQPGANEKGMMICGECSLSSMIITESRDMQGAFCPIEVS